MTVVGFFDFFRPKKAVAVLIDNHNVENAGLGTPDGRYLIRWDKIVTPIKHRTKDAHTIFAGAFTGVYGDNEVLIERWLTNARRRWAEHGFELHTMKEQDIDSLMVSYMWKAAAEAYDGKYKELHFVIVSGDHIFAEAYEHIRDQYRSKLNLKLSVYSWNESLSWHLRELAGRGRFYPLDVIRDLRRPRRKREAVAS